MFFRENRNSGFIFMLAVFLLCNQGCERMMTYPDKPVQEGAPKIISHRGGGFQDRGNTLEGCIFGLNRADGVECDIQKSKNGTIWLDHSSELPPCGSFNGDCFSRVSDEAIADLNTCLGPEGCFTRLDTVLAYMSLYFPEKYLSLDAKAWAPCKVSGLNMIREMNLLGQAIINVVQRYHLTSRILVESENGDLLYYLKQHEPSIGTYLVTNGDLELGMSRCLQGGFSGISFKYGFDEALIREHVELLHRKGLKIQVWVINDEKQLETLKALKVDFIQTDDSRFFPSTEK